MSDNLAGRDDYARLEEIVIEQPELSEVVGEHLINDAYLQAEFTLRTHVSEDAHTLHALSGLLESNCMDGELSDAALVDLRGRAARRQRGRSATGFLVVAASLLIGALSMLAWQSFKRQGESIANRQGVANYGDTTGMQPFAAGSGHGASQQLPLLVKMTACGWESPESVPPSVGSSLEVGKPLTLQEGVAELEVEGSFSGVSRVRIEGPARFATMSPGVLSLDYGVLTATTTGPGTVISINTVSGVVKVAADSTIGIVADGEKEEVHVFEGRARLIASFAGEAKSVDPELGKPVPIVLYEGEAVSLSRDASPDSRLAFFEASMRIFASSRSMGFDRLSVGKEYVDAVLKSKPSVYYRFENEGHDIPNLGDGPAMSCSVEGGVTWRRFDGNTAAEFGLTGSTGAFVCDAGWPSKLL